MFTHYYSKKTWTRRAAICDQFLI